MKFLHDKHSYGTEKLHNVGLSQFQVRFLTLQYQIGARSHYWHSVINCKQETLSALNVVLDFINFQQKISCVGNIILQRIFSFKNVYEQYLD